MKAENIVKNKRNGRNKNGRLYKTRTDSSSSTAVHFSKSSVKTVEDAICSSSSIASMPSIFQKTSVKTSEKTSEKAPEKTSVKTVENAICSIPSMPSIAVHFPKAPENKQ